MIVYLMWGLVRYNIQNWIAGPEILEGRITGSPHGVSTLRPDLGPPVTHRLATRPPLAGPYAFSRIPPPVWNKPRVFLMHDILNTWLFTNFSSGYLSRISCILLVNARLRMCGMYTGCIELSTSYLVQVNENS